MPVIYYLESRANKKNEHPIRLSVIVKGARIQSTTGFSISAEAWDKDKMRVLPHQTNSKKQTSAFINKRLNGIEGIFLDFENSCRVRPSVDKLKELLASYNPDATGADEQLGENGEQIPIARKRPSAIEYFDEFRKEQSISNQWTAGTMECWAAFRKHLLACAKSSSFDWFNEDGINAFIRYLRTTAQMEEKTVQKHYLNLRWFLNWAIRKGYASEREISKIQPKFKVLEKPVIFLTKEELLKLYKFEVLQMESRLHSTHTKGKNMRKSSTIPTPSPRHETSFAFAHLPRSATPIWLH